MEQKTLLTTSGIVKRFPGVVALKAVDFDLRAGEVHILLGENGAGKSTLAKCILGAYIPEEGTIAIDGKTLKLKNPRDALANGIVAVYQEFTLVPWLSVAQNIFLNREYRRKNGFLDMARMEAEARELLARLDCDTIDVKMPVKKLKVAQQQMVEVAKALSCDPKIIIFDEPTATLSEREVSCLFTQIRKLRDRGVGIIYVSHKIQEFEQIGDRISVFRDGCRIGTYGMHEKTTEELVNLMVGRSVSQTYQRSENPHTGEVLRCEHLKDRAGRVKDVSFVLHRGEILGLAGLVGAGRTEISNLIFGIDPLASGEITLRGEKITGRMTPRKMMKRGMGFVCEDRRRCGLSLRENITQNLTAVCLDMLFPKGVLRNAKMTAVADEWRGKLRIMAPDLKTICSGLSGGNQQKVVLGKWLSANADILIFDEPTRGIDVGAKLELYQLMNELSLQGKSILLISSELPEIMGMSDRILVIHEGRITGEVLRGTPDFTQEKVGGMMLGTLQASEPASANDEGDAGCVSSEGEVAKLREEGEPNA